LRGNPLPLEIVSEASGRLPDDLKARHPSITGRNIAGGGNAYCHDCEDVAASFVWVALQDQTAAGAQTDRAQRGRALTAPEADGALDSGAARPAASSVYRTIYSVKQQLTSPK
jgi:hypothetical protein